MVSLALRVLSASNIIVLLLVCSCAKPAATAVHAYSADSIFVQLRNGIVHHNDKPFTGSVYKLMSNGSDTLYINEFLAGKENGLQKKWYGNGKLCELRSYSEGLKTGRHQGYWDTGEKRFEYNFEADMYEGVQYEWYPSGRLYAKRQYLHGHENGLQQVWDKEGKLISSYEARNGRNYGNIGKKECASARHDSI